MKIGRFEITADKYQFILTENYLGIDKKDRSDKMQKRLSYHASLEQVCNTIIERDAKEALDGDVYAVIEAITKSKCEIFMATSGVKKIALL
jgi:hypothetical protein